MADTSPFSIRVRLAKPSQDAGGALAKARELTQPNAKVAGAITLGAQKLIFRAQKERFTGKGPFPVSECRLGVVSGRLRRDLHAEPVTITPSGYSFRMGSNVEYFGAHEMGFNGTVQVPAHQRGAYTVNRKPLSRTTKSGKVVEIPANQYSVLPQSVRAHSRTLKIPARKPLATAIQEHGAEIIGAEISKALRAP